MLQNPIVKFFIDLFVQDWAFKLVAGPLLTVFIYFVLWIFAKEDDAPVIAPKKRKWFALAGIITGFVVVHICATAYHGFGGGVRAADFDCELLSDPVLGTDAADGTTATVFYQMSILNRGEPSIIRKWQCTVDIGGGLSSTEKAVFLPSTLWMPDSSGKLVQAPSSAYLPSILSEARLDRYNQKVGWAFFRFPKLTLGDFKPGVKITLQFEDATGKKNISQFTVPLDSKKVVTATNLQERTK